MCFILFYNDFYVFYFSEESGSMTALDLMEDNKKLWIYACSSIMIGHLKTLFYAKNIIYRTMNWKNHYYRIAFLCFLKNKK